MIYFTSDTHFGHANIAGKNVSKWKEGYRDFNSLGDMNAALIKGINDTVGQHDTLYHLGDWSFGGIENIWKFRSQIICQEIHLILGNHDHHIEENRILPNVISSEPYGNVFIDGDPKNFGGMTAGDGEYPNYVEAQRLFASVSHYKELKINGKMFVLSHYAHRVWHGSHKGWYHLYAHSHDSLDYSRTTHRDVEYGKSMDIGVDPAKRLLGNYRPFAENEITRILDKRSIAFVDHHDKNTNVGKTRN